MCVHCALCTVQPSTGVWMVGPEPGRDFGGILNRQGGLCPEDLTADWEYYRSFLRLSKLDISLVIVNSVNRPETIQ